jgi:hypothetical protein
MKHVLRIAKKFDAFYCPVNRLHLSVYSPVGQASVVSEQILRALKVKKIIDVNGTIIIEDPKAEKVLVEGSENPLQGEKLEEAPENEPEVKPELEPELDKESEEEVAKEAALEDYLGPEPEQGIALESLDKEELLSFVKENDITYKELGITGKSSEEKIREALAAHLTDESDEK